MTILLLLLFAAAPDETPVIDEGDRWEQAAVVFQLGETPFGHIYFWRPDQLGILRPAGHLGWHDLESVLWRDGLFEFRWYDQCAGRRADANENMTYYPAHRVCRVPTVYMHVFPCGVKWQPMSCGKLSEGFLPLILELPVVERAK